MCVGGGGGCERRWGSGKTGKMLTRDTMPLSVLLVCPMLGPGSHTDPGSIAQ